MNAIEIKLKRYRSRDCMGTGSVDLISKRTFMLEHECHSWKDEVPFKAVRYYVSPPENMTNPWLICVKISGIQPTISVIKLRT